MKAFYGDRFKPHMTKTPEGFLVCHSVPICRTGTQQYLPSELGIKGHGLIDVLRNEDEVFKPSAIASFEGKPVTDEHPPTGVDPVNYGSYVKGTVQNVHRGTGDDATKLICDLVIYDAALISKIDSGKRDVSCGYDCKYIENGDGTYHQADIVGNHVAVVDAGRAGHEVSIRDSKPKGERRMGRKNILQRMFAAFAKDAEPEEIREAARAVDAAENGELKPEQEAAPTETHDEDMDLVINAIHELNQKIEALSKAKAQDEEPIEPPKSALDSLEEQLGGKSCDEDPTENEESVTVSPEQLNDEEPEEVQEDLNVEQKEAPEDVQEEKAQDRAISLAMLRAMKPIIASMPKAQQKKASDALNRAVKKAMRVESSQPLVGGYGALGQRKTADALAKQGNPRAFGENCRKFNPHHKK